MLRNAANALNMTTSSSCNQSPMELERALLVIERRLPYLRRHLAELNQSPTRQHAEQASATAAQMLESLERIADHVSACRSLATL